MINLNSFLFHGSAAASETNENERENGENATQGKLEKYYSTTMNEPGPSSACELTSSAVNCLPQSETRSRSNSSYTDSLETDELTGINVNGTDTHRRRRRSRLPVKKQSSLNDSNSNCSVTCDEQNRNLQLKSFPETRYKSEYIPRSQSVSELWSNLPQVAKETITSRMRFEKHHSDHDHNVDESEEYLTPTQRKDQLIKNLKKKLKELTIQNSEKETEIEQLKSALGQERHLTLEIKNAEIKRLEENLRITQDKCNELTNSCEESVKTIDMLQKALEELRETNAQQQVKHQQMYFEMYKKGQESARFERDEELEMLATSSKNPRVSVREVVRKLSRTQSELARWQSLKREEIYTDANKPETEADTILRFLKDSFFHYVTGGKDSDDHLRAIVRIFNYPDVQRKKIEMAQKSHKNGKH